MAIATNVEATLPPYLAIAWRSVERACWLIDALAIEAVPSRKQLVDSSSDFGNCFKMTRLAGAKHWKECVYVQGELVIDIREKTVRIASDHFGQRTYFLISVTAMDRVATHI